MIAKHALTEVADQYRREGYEVIEQPSPEQLPPFARGYGTSLLAHRDEQRVLVQVKESRDELRGNPELVRLAQAVNNEPGWRIDLVVLGGPPPQTPVGTREPEAEAILRNLTTAEQLATTGETTASFVMSWAALEAAMRHAGRAAGIEMNGGAPAFVLRALYSGGLLDRAEFDRLNEAMKVRNAIVRGLTIPPLDDAAVREVGTVARRLVSQSRTDAAS